MRESAHEEIFRGRSETDAELNFDPSAHTFAVTHQAAFGVHNGEASLRHDKIGRRNSRDGERIKNRSAIESAQPGPEPQPKTAVSIQVISAGNLAAQPVPVRHRDRESGGRFDWGQNDRPSSAQDHLYGDRILPYVGIV